MNKITYELEKLDRPEYIEDSIKIVKIAFEHGVLLQVSEAEKIWLDYSDSLAAGWINLPKDDNELWLIISEKDEYNL